jgi:deoxyribonuclease-4
MSLHTPLLGAHMLASGGLFKALLAGEALGCTAIQLFTRNNRQWHFEAVKDEEIEAWNKTLKQTSIKSVVSHASYLINLGSPSEELRMKSRNALIAEIIRCHQLGIDGVVFHPGSHVTSPRDECIALIAHEINEICKETPVGPLILLENSAGQGSSVGTTFEELAKMMHKADPARVGVCIDTCHAWSAGYRFGTEEEYHEFWKDFDKTLGRKNLHALHLNDSKKACGSRVDRHDHIGEGMLTLEPFARIMNDHKLASIPKILETPKDVIPQDDIRNLATLRSLIR